MVIRYDRLVYRFHHRSLLVLRNDRRLHHRQTAMTACPFCGLDRPLVKPDPGNVSLCTLCCEYSVMSNAGKQLPPSRKMWRMLNQDPAARQMQRKWLAFRRQLFDDLDVEGK